MYSTVPWSIINTADDHFGFWVIFTVLTIIFVLAFSATLEDGDFARVRHDHTGRKTFINPTWIIIPSIYLVIISAAAYRSWTTGEYFVPANTQHRATMVDVSSGTTRTTGRYAVTVTYPTVAYQLEDGGVVTFRTESGSVWYPEIIVFKR